MDEANQQKAASDAGLKDFDCDTSKLIANEKIVLELAKKSSCGVSDSDAVIEALNTNGIDKESEAPSGDNFPKNDSELIQSQENTIQEKKSSNDNIQNDSEVQLTVPSEDFIDSSKKFSDNTDSEINSDLQSGKQNYRKPNDLSDNVRVCPEKDTISAGTTISLLENQLIENIESKKECIITNVSEGSKPDEGFKETGDDSDISSKGSNREEDDKKAEINITAECENENELVNFDEEGTITVDEESPVKYSENENEIISPVKELFNVVKTTGLLKNENDNAKTLKSDAGKSGDTDCIQITLVENELSKIIKGDKKENPVTQLVSNTNLHTVEQNSQVFVEEDLKGKAGEGDLLLQTEMENQLINSRAFEEKNIKESMSNSELHSETSNKTEQQCNNVMQSEAENKIKNLSHSELQSESEKEIEEINSSKVLCEIKHKTEHFSKNELPSATAGKTEKNISSEVESKLENVVGDQGRRELQSEVEKLIDDSSNHELQSESENKISDLTEGITEIFPVEIESDNKVTIPVHEKISKESDECKISHKHSEIFTTESEKENSDLENKDRVQECSSRQDVNINSSAEQDEEEEEEENNLNRSENEGNEILDTEMVNCSEIEQIDLSENETDLKGESRDEDMVSDSLETPGEKSNEDQMPDERENSGAVEKSTMLIDDEEVNEPGNSEEETITGDTTNQPTVNLTKEKDEEICIIPDDVIPTILPQVKDVGSKEGENGGMTVLKITSSETVKPKTRAQDKKNQELDSKARPVRNAAKLAGNKIKSLVESDLVFDENALSGKLVGDSDFQENTDESAQMCAQCREVKVCKLLSVQNDVTQYLCSEQCSAAFRAAQMDAEPNDTDNTLRENMRKCGQCHSQITVDENRLFWETVDFCNEDCLRKYQLDLGSHCANCKKTVPSTSLGKYCVRFGYDIKQFCSALCLEEYKKGLKVCSYCQKDISTGTEGFLAPVGNKGQFKDFCTQSCMEKYDRMSSNKPLPEVIEECAVCSNSKPVQVEVELDNKTHKLCSEPCFAAFKFVNNITEGQCDMCRKYFDRSKIPNYSLRLLFYDETLRTFCSKTCTNVYILANRKIVPCNWCKVKKYNFDMIKKASPDGQLTMMCSLNCLMLYQTSVNAVCSRPIMCDFCKKKFVRQPLYHLTMSDATLRNFCSYNCVMSFQNGHPKQKVEVLSGSDQLSSPIPTGVPKRIVPKRSQTESTCVPVISSVQSLASPNGPVSPSGRVQIPRDVNMEISVPPSPIPAPPPQVYQQIITKPAPAKQMKNKSVLCKPYSHTKGVSCRPHPCMKETQTDQSLNRKFLIPIPVPIYVPAPMHMFATPFPVPVPFPLPVPVPIFIPTTRNSAKGIMKEIKKIQEKIPTDPFEAELLMMAEMVAGDKKQDPTDSESEDGNEGDDNGDGTFSPENVDTSNTFGDDMLQMALKMASELEEPAVDMESVLTSNTITTSTPPAVDPNKALYASDTDDPDQVNVMAMNRGRKRSVRGSRNSSGGTPSKRGRRTSGSVDVPLLPPPEPVPPRTIEVEKPDANMCLKYTFGVNAWRHWVMQKNAELEKAALTNRKIKLFKPELLQLTADELNFSLCLFVKEVRKPNGTEYAPDTIYYLCLGIQQYLFENGRIDNIFTDSYYEKFTDCLDEVAKKFAALFNDSQYIVTRVEEEHLWESKQLGAHSPHVLLSTLMFFNTKHFNLVTVEEHMQLSFSHIMKHWKRNPNTPGVAKVPGSRNVLLRFYPPQSALEANSRKKKVYEQQENEENPLRCPVKLYEFYLSKCPESVKTRNDVFYLLPERSCVPDSPVWYSTMALGKEPLMKMLHRIKMVKEINIALLTS